MIDEERLARDLDEAIVQRKEIAPLTKTYGDFDLETAYRVQERGIALRLARGETIAGYKMGLTSAAKRVQMNLGAPIYGLLTNTMRVEREVRVAEGVHPKIEPEIAFVTGRELRGKISREEALAGCCAVAPALEILDSRFIGFKYFSLPDVVADNCSSWRFVIGPLHAQRVTGGLRMRMSLNGRVVQETDSNSISGNPIESLVQLVAMLDAHGRSLPAGTIVLAGAATVAEPLRPGALVSLEVESLGKMDIRAV